LVRGFRARRAFRRTEDDPVREQCGDTGSEKYWHLGESPQGRQDEQQPFERNARCQVGHGHRAKAEKEEERAADQTILLGRQAKLGHHGPCGQCQYGTVTIIDDHERHEQSRDAPGASRRQMDLAALGVATLDGGKACVFAGHVFPFWAHNAASDHQPTS